MSRIAVLALIFVFSLGVAGGLIGCREDADKTPVSSMTIGPAGLAAGTEGLQYSQTLSVTGAVGTPVWALAPTSDPLPNGLALNGLTGVISGTPATGSNGGYSIIVRVDDGFGSAQRTYGLAISAPVLQILTSSLPAATEGSFYTTTLVGFGGNGGPYTFSIDPTTQSSMPAALQLAGATGVITGAPEQLTSGTYNIRFVVSDGASTATRVLALTVIRPPLNFSTTLLPYAVAELAYTATLAGSGGTYNYAWGVSPASDDPLPTGLSLNATTGEITGAADAAAIGNHNITFTLFDGEKTNLKVLSLRVVPLPVTLSAATLLSGSENAAYSDVIFATGGSGTYTYSIASGQQLPTGLSLDPNTGEISGTPAFDTVGTYNFNVTVNDGQANATAVISFTIAKLDPATLLPSLVAGRGGMAGGAAKPNQAITVMAIDSLTGAPLQGIGVVRGTSVGSVGVSSVTDGNGQAVLIGSDVAQCVTFVDPVTGAVKSYLGTAQAPLREVMVAAMPRAPKYSVTINGIAVGQDLVVTLNGREVFATDAASIAGESFTIDWESEDDVIVGSAEAWLLIAHSFQDDTLGQVDRNTLVSTAWMRDSDGASVADGVIALTLNMASGVGTAGQGLSSGTAPVLTLTGTITRPDLPASFGATARISAFLDTPYGMHEYSHYVATPTDPFLLLPPLGPNYDYSLTVPNFASIPTADVTSHTRLVELTVASTTDTIAALTTVGIGAKLSMVSNGSGQIAGGAVSFTASVPSLQLVTANIAIGTDTVSSQSANSVSAELFAAIDESTWVSSRATGANGQLAFPFLAGLAGTPIAFTNTYLSLDAGFDASGATYASGAGIQTLTPREVSIALSGDGNTGSPGAGVAVSMRLSDTGLGLATTSPIPATTFSLSVGTFGWLGTGLDGRDGLYMIRLAIPATGGGTRYWTMEAPAGATQIAGVSSYLFALPKLPLGLPYSEGAMTAAMNAVGVEVSYLDTTNVGLDLLQRRNSDLAYPKRAGEAKRLSPGGRVAAFGAMWYADFATIADVDPVA